MAYSKIQIDPFQRIVNVNFGGFNLLYSPIYDPYLPSYGWGSPFYSGDPPSPINIPYGTELDSSSTQSERHKYAKGGTVTEFGKQFPTFQGNKHWTDGTKTVCWWGAYGFGTSDRIAPNIYTDDIAGTAGYTMNVGDIGTVWGSCSAFLGNYQYVTGIITGKKAGSNSFYIQDLQDINDKFWIDGVEVSPAVFHIQSTGDCGTYGRWITGACAIGDWLIYADVKFGTVYGGNHTEYINAYNTVTTEYRLLGSFSTYTTDQYWYNCQPIVFSQDGLKFITNRDYDGTWSRYRTGTISLDGNGDPVSMSTQWDSTNYQFSGLFYWGYKDNVETVLAWYNQYAPSDRLNIYVYDWDVNTGFMWGKVLSTDTTAPCKYLLVQVEEKVFLYACGSNGRVTSFASPTLSYNSLNEYIQANGKINSILHNDGRTSSTSIKGVGAFICTRAIMWDWAGSGLTGHDESLNILIKPDGSGHDLGELLLTTNENGADFVVAPMNVTSAYL